LLANPLHFLSGYELSMLTLLVGVLVSAFTRSLTGSNPGGVIAVAFIALAAINSLWWLPAIALVAVVIVKLYDLFFSHMYLGRQPQFVMAALSVVLMFIAGSIMLRFHAIDPNPLAFPASVIAPAILAIISKKQGFLTTFSYAAFSTLMTLGVVSCLYIIGRYLGHDFYSMDRLIESRQHLHLGWFEALALLSIGIGFTIYRWFNVKAAGFIMLPFLSILCIVSPVNFALLMVLTVLTYAVTAVMRRYSLIVGISRYTFVFVLATCLVSVTEMLLLTHTEHFSPFMGSGIFATLAITVLVNEHTIYGIRRTVPALLVSIAVMASIEVGGIVSFQAASHHPISLHDYVVRHTAPKGT